MVLTNQISQILHDVCDNLLSERRDGCSLQESDYHHKMREVEMREFGEYLLFHLQFFHSLSILSGYTWFHFKVRCLCVYTEG